MLTVIAPTPRAYSAITTTLQSQHASFIALAAKVAEVEASLDDVKQQFAALYKARTGSALDPFGRVSS
jgi:nucleoporin p58/p45